MTPSNNIVPLPDHLDAMKSKRPIFYTVAELFKRYPTLAERGWTEDDLEQWVSQDIITGRHQENKAAILEVEKESIEAFLAYHNQHLMHRVNRVEEDLERAKKTGSRTGQRNP